MTGRRNVLGGVRWKVPGSKRPRGVQEATPLKSHPAHREVRQSRPAVPYPTAGQRMLVGGVAQMLRAGLIRTRRA